MSSPHEGEGTRQNEGGTLFSPQRPQRSAIERLKGEALSPGDFFDGAVSGLYIGVPEEEYHAHPALSRSVLAEAARYSPLHAYHKWQSDDDSGSDATSLGTALHTAVLQPGLYEDTYDVAPEECEATKGDGDPCTYSAKYRHDGTWYCGTHAPDGEPDDINVLKSDAHEEVLGMRSALKGDPDTSPMLFELDGLSELTILFEGPATGLECKARLDRVVQLPNGGVSIVDLKTTQSAHPADFRRSVARYGYWLQEPFYELALREGADADLDVKDFVFATVESSEPYAVQPYRLHPKERGGARRRMGELLSQMGEAMETGVFAGYADGVANIGMKRYAKDRLDITA